MPPDDQSPPPVPPACPHCGSPMVEWEPGEWFCPNEPGLIETMPEPDAVLVAAG